MKLDGVLLMVGLVALLVAAMIAAPVESDGLKSSDRVGSSLMRQPNGPAQIYLPLIQKTFSSVIPDPPSNTRRINAPYFNVADIGATKFSETAIFWFGRVSATENYADVRVGYNNSELYVYVAAFDQRLWYDAAASGTNLTSWDAATLLINTGGNTGATPTTSAYRFIAELNWFEPRANYQTAYRGNGTTWIGSATTFSTTTGWRGLDAPNVNSANHRGWVAAFHIPFTSLGLSGPPATGTMWGMSMLLHDRDDAAGTPIADKTWPESINIASPSTWGQLAFGLPTYTPPVPSGGGVVMIRRLLQKDATVPDAAVGGTTSNQCPGAEPYIWDTFENLNYGHDPDFNIMNESDVSDWPCFARYYVEFPLTAIPAGKKIITATLTLHEWGGSDPTQAQPSWIQVATFTETWSENTLTWNNAPLARENIGGTWVNPLSAFPGWPGVISTWNVSRAVAEAYANGQPVRLILYEADSAYHSGKFFVSSDTGDWNIEGRPRLDVRWSEP